MFESARQWALRCLRVPPEPQAPSGDAGSVQVFRAAPNFFRLRLALWGVQQAVALLGIVFWLMLVGYCRLQWQAQQVQAGGTAPAAATAAGPEETAALEPETASNPPSKVKRSRRRTGRTPGQIAGAMSGEITRKLPGWALPVFIGLEVLGVLFFAAQAMVSYVVLRLDYEQRWYMVTDRSLRIRSGVWTVWEMTMSFANLQQVVVTQGPLQRWLGLADLRVESAGGGGPEPEKHGAARSLHVGFFHGVGNAEEIRDLILARLREFRLSGLGDPDEPAGGPESRAGSDRNDVLAAAQDLLTAARALRRDLRP